MERELLEVFEAARKAADASEKGGDPADVDRCVEALRRLSEMPVTVKVLVDTQVGKKLRSHLTKHPLKKIQKVASELCELWKKKVIEETSKKKESSGSEKNSVKAGEKLGRAEAVKVEKVQKASSMEIDRVSRSESFKVEKRDGSQKIKVENVSRSESFKVEKNGQGETTSMNSTNHRVSVEAEKITKEEKQASTASGPSLSQTRPPKLTSMVKCNDVVRDKTRELFAEALAKVSGEADEDIRDEVEACDPVRVAVLLESVMFEKLGRSNGTHKQKYRSILFNLKDQKNPDLRRRVLLGHIKPDNIINMTAEGMASDERKLQNKQIKDKALFECERGMAPKASTDQFKCGRCGQRKCTYYQMQTRSADEPMTTYVTCVNCNNHWKFC